MKRKITISPYSSLFVFFSLVWSSIPFSRGFGGWKRVMQLRFRRKYIRRESLAICITLLLLHRRTFQCHSSTCTCARQLWMMLSLVQQTLTKYIYWSTSNWRWYASSKTKKEILNQCQNGFYQECRKMPAKFYYFWSVNESCFAGDLCSAASFLIVVKLFSSQFRISLASNKATCFWIPLNWFDFVYSC